MAYKKLIKVSNVCQLLDKSKYPATKTINGVTFTNNGDGTFTVNGTAESGSGFRLDTFYIEGNRTYLMIGCPEGGGAGKYFMFDGYSKPGSDLGSGIIKTVSGSDRTLCSPILYVVTGQTVSNLVFKPQLFDLTEMYGAGHEPTTVEQFRQDFPEEMYDYSPHCWLTSYKRVIMTGAGNYLTTYQRNLTCKTKNLFDISSVTDVCYYSNNASIDSSKWSIDGNIFKCAIGMHKGRLYLKPKFTLKAGIYTLSSYALMSNVDNSGSRVYVGYINFTDGTNKSASLISNGTVTLVTHNIILEQDSEIALILQGNGTADNNEYLDSTFWNIQIEKGSTATEYVPYGHL